MTWCLFYAINESARDDENNIKPTHYRRDCEETHLKEDILTDVKKYPPIQQMHYIFFYGGFAVAITTECGAPHFFSRGHVAERSRPCLKVFTK